MKEYYYLISDYGYGSSELRFFKNKESAEYLIFHGENEYSSNEEVGILLADNLLVRFEDV